MMEITKGDIKQNVAGAITGAIATLPMTAVMVILNRFPKHEATPLPPERVSAGMARKLGVFQHLDRSEREVFKWGSHLLFGSFLGVLYQQSLGRKIVNPAWSGGAFGLMAWAVNYAGWLPLMKLVPNLRQVSNQRLSIQIISHLVWGSTNAYLLQRWSGRRHSMVFT